MVKYFSSMCFFLCIVFFNTPLQAQSQIDTTATWIFSTGASVYSSPVCDSAFVYIGSDDSSLYCLNRTTGVAQWVFHTHGMIRCKPALLDSIVYFESEDGNCYAVHKILGTVIWKTNIGNTLNKRVLPDLTTSDGNVWDYMQSSPCIDSGVVYIGSGDSCIYALNAASGTVVWKKKTSNVVRATACVVGDLIYTGSWDGSIYAINKGDGSVCWKYSTGGVIQCSPRYSNGIVYCGSRDGYFYALDVLTGTLKWKFLYSFSYPYIESSAWIENGVVYVGSSDLEKVFAFNATTGSVLWNSSVGGDTWSSPLLHNGTIYVGLATYDWNSTTTPMSGSLLVMNAATGNIKWRYNTKTSPFIGGVVSSPALYQNLVYFGSLDGKVYAVDTAFQYGQSTGINQRQSTLKIFHLNNNYPNPFNPSTTIEYQVNVQSTITLRVYDVMGKEVAVLVNGMHAPGNYKVVFDGSRYASGIYFNKLTSGTLSETKLMVLVK